MTEPEHPSSSASRFELLVQSVTDYAIYMLDPEGRVTSWNAGARRFKGYEAEEIIGEHFSRFYTPEEREQQIPGLRWKQPNAKGALKSKAGASARTAADFGRMSSSIRSVILLAASSASPRSPAI